MIIFFFQVKVMIAEQNKHPEEYVKMFQQYMHLINGQSERETEAYVSEEHTFDEFKERVLYFDNLGKVINNEISKVRLLCFLALSELKWIKAYDWRIK